MNLDIAFINDILDILVKITVLVGVPVGLYRYFVETRRERESREYASYDALDAKYMDFLMICFENPKLDIWDLPYDDAVGSKSKEKRQEYVALMILISILERAFIMYRNQSKPFRKQQWLGWEKYIRGYACRENFRQVWETCNTDEFDAGFHAFMTRIIQEEDRKQALAGLHRDPVTTVA